ncbi:hypothetical protein [Mycolicibacterium parafortuitum]|uniref:Scaffolding protein n=1 Tax=Mycolicibacterium parafortuitum TaxID=39692 RepID=A0A375Z5L1_MYCPF|nr:hypothetical protein [Mycolicibacterium parafortuitum]ORB32029.1 hypothetical protein BST38_04660 [Mycolicibacterium parafortuitum]SSA20675.1 hypothetical protein MPP7335_05829 [Mycolicibacterium parafortuitum]
MTNTAENAPDLDSDGLSATPEGDGPEADVQSAGGDDTQTQAPRQNREARYRVERNEARAERDALAQRVERLLTREAERLAAKNLANPADLLTLGGVTVQDLLDEDGDVDPEKVDAVIAEILGTRPGLAKNSPAFDPTQGLSGGGHKPQASWDALMK